jgi:exopolysaccharide biosynthesis polyprenyl glycosylphosphotransferase
MQSEFERDISMNSMRRSSAALEEVLPEEELCASHITASGPVKSRRRKFSPTGLRFVLILGDELCFIGVLVLVLLFSPHLDLTLRFSSAVAAWFVPPLYVKMLLGALAMLSWNIAINITQAHNQMSIANRLRSPLRILGALTVMLISWVGLAYLIIISSHWASPDIIVYSRMLLFFMAVAVPVLVIWRVALAAVLNLPRFRCQAVIVGANKAGAVIAEELERMKNPTIDVVGYISETPAQQSPDAKLPVLGGSSALCLLAQQGTIDMIIMAIDYKVNTELFQQAIEAAQLGVSLVPMSVAYERISGKIPVEHVGDQWFLALPLETVASPFYLCWNRALDLVFGLIGTLLLLPIFPIVALMIALDSRGPIFYAQERLGYQGKKFSIYKFRSMYTNAEREGAATWAKQSDKRVTRVGRILRATHLDELPQVFNILRGEMSLIGPRPERQEFVTELEKTIPFYRCRLVVKPGLTGWAQVKYRYGSSRHDALVKLQYDLFYIKHRSFTLDILIMLRTVWEVIFCRGV